MDVLICVFGEDKVGIKLTPTGRFNDMYDSNPLELMKYILKELENKKIAFVEIKRHGSLESAKPDSKDIYDENGLIYPEKQMPDFFDSFRSLYSGTLIFNDSITKEEAI